MRRSTLSLAVAGAVVGGVTLTLATAALAPVDDSVDAVRQTAGDAGVAGSSGSSGSGSSGSEKATAAERRAVAGAASATAVLRLADGTEVGSVRFTDGSGGGGTDVSVDLDVPDGATRSRAFHGFHVHANDDPANGEGCKADPAEAPATWFTAVDGHLKDGDQTHGDHVGDMPSLDLDETGRAHAEFTTWRFSPDDLAGRAVVLHDAPDNLGNVPTGSGSDQYTPNRPAAADKTHGTGNAGNRVACGVVR